MNEALDRVVEALAGASEDEVAAASAALGASSSRPPAPADLFPDASAGPWGASQIVSEVEWV